MTILASLFSASGLALLLGLVNLVVLILQKYWAAQDAKAKAVEDQKKYIEMIEQAVIAEFQKIQQASKTDTAKSEVMWDKQDAEVKKSLEDKMSDEMSKQLKG